MYIHICEVTVRNKTPCNYTAPSLEASYTHKSEAVSSVK